jgi:hypothetical protein
MSFVFMPWPAKARTRIRPKEDPHAYAGTAKGIGVSAVIPNVRSGFPTETSARGVSEPPIRAAPEQILVAYRPAISGVPERHMEEAVTHRGDALMKERDVTPAFR